MEAPRRSLAASLSPLRLIDRRKSFSYSHMPEEPINLTVLKLDGSSFGWYHNHLASFVSKNRVIFMYRVVLMWKCFGCLCRYWSVEDSYSRGAQDGCRSFVFSLAHNRPWQHLMVHFISWFWRTLLVSYMWELINDDSWWPCYYRSDEGHMFGHSSAYPLKIKDWPTRLTTSLDSALKTEIRFVFP